MTRGFWISVICRWSVILIFSVVSHSHILIRERRSHAALVRDGACVPEESRVKVAQT